jgi:hypothetical protein
MTSHSFPTRRSSDLIAMIFGAMGILYGSWFLILVMLGVEGVQATIFSPALNGSIPELYPTEYVLTANAIIRMISTAAILAGIAAAGFVLDIKGAIGQTPLNLAMISMLVIGVSLGGLLVSFGVARFSAAAPGTKFPWNGPMETLKVLYRTRFDPLLAIAIAGNAFFWFVGALEVLVLNQLGISQFKFSNSMTSGMVAAEFVGVAIGGVLSIYLTKKVKWQRMISPVVAIMGISMVLVASVPYFSGPAKMIYLFAILALMGITGGMYAIPLEAFIQIRPAADCKGATIAAANFSAFSGMLLSGPTLNLFNALNITPANDLAVMGVMTLITAVLLFFFLRRSREAI